ncbi:MAG TPA: 4-alpha-glucanotransferase [Thermomicrobiales bacterium]|nr:4-alpha-glucanotransferase [Thermomicrobiales bacterium]
MHDEEAGMAGINPRGTDRDEREETRLPPSRYSGVLAHPTSLPGPHGIGDLGAEARRFIDWLARAGQQRWQILPLGPTGFGDSPYASYSAFAGNPLLISLGNLVEERLLEESDIQPAGFPDDLVDFDAVTAFKLPLLARAAERFHAGQAGQLRDEYRRFRDAQAAWLDDYTLFRALKAEQDGALWSAWPRPLALRDPDALRAARDRLKHDIDTQCFMQFAFFRQWGALRRYANERGVRVLGDIPIFVALDSADVWANSAQFQLDERGRPTSVAGVPPDYFSATGQLWGNPLYDWDAMRADGYRWWIERFRAVYSLVDIARIDHFRGFEDYWSVPAGEETAIRGSWKPGPGRALFDAVWEALGDLPVVAEDLGMMTKDVDDLRESLGFPGMSVLQFAFGSGSDNLYLPHNLARNTVVYTGTHDNDTTVGWFDSADDNTRDHARRYLGVDGADVAWDLIQTVLASVAETAIVPLQDLLRLGTQARMNLPGRATGNWGWRMQPGALTDEMAERLAGLLVLYGREQGVGSREQAQPRNH